MSSISSKSSQSARSPRKPKWRSSQFLSTSAQPATSISKVVAQPLQGSPLRPAIEGLPSVSSILDDHRSIYSSNGMRKEVRDEESRSSQESPRQAGESETTLECISKERAEGVTEDAQGEANPCTDV